MIKATALDRLISYFSPERGATRLAARKRMEILGYEGARVGRREKSWSTPTTSANAEISGDRLRLRDRVRSLLRDNPYAVKGALALVTNRVGTGILISADGPNKRANNALDEMWERWVDRCDATGKTDFYGIQALAEKTRVESGEALIRLIRPTDVDEDDVGLRLAVLEPDYIDTAKNERLDNGNEIREGIEYRGNVAVAYWLYDSHPGDSSPIQRYFPHKSTRFSASEILHYYRVQRPGQLTGVSEFAPVIRRLYDIDGYADAALMRKKISACSVAFVTTPAGLPGASLGPSETDSEGRRLESIAPGMTHYGAPGENITFFDPKPESDYRQFMTVELHAVAAGLGVPYELLTGDLVEVNYTSHRGGLVQFRAQVEADQWQLVIPQLCRPIWDRFVSEALMKPGFEVKAKFTPPRFGLLDPAKEVPAQIEALKAGIDSYPNLIRREGYEWREKLDEIEEFQKELKSRGIVLPGLELVTEETQEPRPPEPAAPEQPDEDEQQAA